jgi:hypothetical protein
VGRAEIPGSEIGVDATAGGSYSRAHYFVAGACSAAIDFAGSRPADECRTSEASRHQALALVTSRRCAHNLNSARACTSGCRADANAAFLRLGSWLGGGEICASGLAAITQHHQR